MIDALKEKLGWRKSVGTRPTSLDRVPPHWDKRDNEFLADLKASVEKFLESDKDYPDNITWMPTTSPWARLKGTT